jgi:hypothetical protein
MLKNNKLRVGAVAAAAAAVALVACAAVPAFADPTAGSFKTLSGVGSDTIQDVLNGLGSQISAIGSYDAVDTNGVAGGNIQTKAGGATFVRPNGSGAGLNALSDSIQGGSHTWNGVNVKDQIDFARSSSGPSSSAPGTALTFIPFAQDAVTYAVNQGSDFPRNLPLGSSADATNKLTLYNIYHCTRTTYTDGDGNAVTIHPYVPQANSGTRNFWLGKLGLTDAAIAGTCVSDTKPDGTTKIQEHDGTTLTDPGDIVPFSISQFISQGNHKAITTAYGVNLVERKGQAALGAINGSSPIRLVSGKTVANPTFPVNRLVYNVVSSARAADTNDPINATFVGASSAVCSQSAIIQAFGFTTVANCGATTITGGFTQ